MHREREVHPTHRKSATETHPELYLLFAVKPGQRGSVTGVYASEEEMLAGVSDADKYHSGEAVFFMAKVNTSAVNVPEQPKEKPAEVSPEAIPLPGGSDPVSEDTKP